MSPWPRTEAVIEGVEIKVELSSMKKTLQTCFPNGSAYKL